MKEYTIKKSQISQKSAAIGTGLFVAAGNTYADLPTTSDPTRGATDGNFLELLQNYAYDLFILGGLLLATLALFVVVKNVIASYSEVSTGKSTMGQVAMHAGVGVLLLVFIVFLLTEAAAIL